MLFVIDQSMAAACDASNPSSDVIVTALENIAIARRAGKHLVFARRDVLENLKSSSCLSKRAKAVYKHLYLKYPQIGGYRRKFSRYIEVYADNDVWSIEDYAGKRVMKVSAKHLQDFSLFTETVLLAENHCDVRFYIRLAEAYSYWNRLGNVRIRYEARGGGGSTTADEFESIYTHRNSLCLCVVDSDREFPSYTENPYDNLGNTPRALKQIVEQGEQPLCELIVLSSREVENIVPSRVYEEVVRDDPNRIGRALLIQELESSIDADAIYYLDIRSGIRLKRVLSKPRESPYFKYWSQIIDRFKCHELNMTARECWESDRCLSEESCRCVMFPGLGDGILEEVVEYLEHTSCQKIAEMVSGRLKAEWEYLGETIIAWCCGVITPKSWTTR
jgi:hypothetical protein